MSAAFSKEGFRSLRLAWATLAIAIAAAAGIGWGSHWFLQKERRDDVASQRQLGEARARLETAKREREDLRVSAAMFQDLVNRGILREEKRLELVERLDRLKERHRIIELDYEIAPQRPLPLAGGRVFNAIDIFASRVRVRAKALHEGEALAFVEDLVRMDKGFNPANRCSLSRLEPGAADTVSPRVEADCSLEWISLKDKRGARAS